MTNWARDTRIKAGKEDVSGSRIVTRVNGLVEQVVETNTNVAKGSISAQRPRSKHREKKRTEITNKPSFPEKAISYHG